MRKTLSVLLTLLLIFNALFPALAEEPQLSDDVVILFTNDTHSYIDGPLSFDIVGGLKNELQKQYKYVLLVDAGDAVQGTAYGGMDNGYNIIGLMNAAGYDLAAPGNHETDYNMSGFMDILSWAQFPYISCNFYHEKDGVRGENVLSSGGLFKLGELTLGFVGVMTPETFSKSAPAYFQDENGEFIYGLSGGDTGEELQADVQKAIDSARAQGADLVIGLGHLGLDSASEPWTSATTLSNISGMDAFIDGHSHTECEHSTITDKDGESVVLVQTGEYFHNIGLMIIDAETHEIKTELIGYNELTEKGTDENGEETDVVVGYELVSELYTGAKWPVDEQTAELKNNWITTIEENLGVVIATTELTFDNYDAEGNRISRKQATNSGDLAADALYWLFDDMGMNVDVAITNAGGLRNKAITGEITYTLCKSMHTFGNHACLRTVTGQQLLDALEWGARGIGFDDDIGAFMQVSGITFSIDPTIEPTSVCDEYEMWVSGPTGEYKVQDVQVYNKKTNAYEPLDLEAKYNLSGYDTFLTKAVDGYTMFDGTAVVMDHAMEDYLVLANYFTAFEGGVIEATNSPLLAKYPNMLLDYSDVNGSGRITILPAE